MRVIALDESKTLDEQIADDTERDTLLRQIERLEKQARSAKQPRRKWELAEEARRLNHLLGVIQHENKNG